MCHYIYIYIYIYIMYVSFYIYIYIYIYIYKNLPVDAIVRLSHPRSGDICIYKYNEWLN